MKENLNCRSKSDVMRVRRRRALKLLNGSVEESSGIQAGAVPALLVCNTLYVPWYATPSVYLGMQYPGVPWYATPSMYLGMQHHGVPWYSTPPIGIGRLIALQVLTTLCYCSIQC